MMFPDQPEDDHLLRSRGRHTRIDAAGAGLHAKLLWRRRWRLAEMMAEVTAASEGEARPGA